MGYLTLALAAVLAASAPVPIYVGPNIRGGFVDVDKGVLDSIEDLRQELRENSSLRIVADESAAKLKLYVTARRKFKTGDSVAFGTSTATTPTTASGTGYAVGVEGYRVEAILRISDYERPMMGESQSRWKGCVKSIAEDLAVWLKANRERISDGK